MGGVSLREVEGWSDVSPIDRLVALVQSVLVEEGGSLRKAQWSGRENLLAGHCYVASEAVYHLLGGAAVGLKPVNLKHEGSPHWYLVTASGDVIDPTESQFACPVPHGLGRGKGFLTKQPSKRAQTLMALVLRRPGAGRVIGAARREVVGASRHRNGDQGIRELERAWRTHTNRQSVDYDGMTRWFAAMRRVGQEREAVSTLVRVFRDRSFGSTPDGDFWIFIARLASETIMAPYAAQIEAMIAEGIYPGALAEIRYAGRDYVGRLIALRQDRNFALKGTIDFVTGTRRHVKEFDVTLDAPQGTLRLWTALGGRPGRPK